MTRFEMVARFALVSLLLVAAILAVIKAQSFQPLSTYGPTFAGSLMALFLAVALIREITRYVRSVTGRQQGKLSRSVEHTSAEPLGLAEMRHALRYMAWLVLFVILVKLLGMYITAGVFVVGFLFLEARRSVVFVAASVVAVLALLWVFGHYVHLMYPLGSLTGV